MVGNIALFAKMVACCLVGMILVATPGCEDPLDKGGIDFKNKSSHDVTVYWRHANMLYSQSFLLKPGEDKTLEEKATSSDDKIEYDWDPKGTVSVDQDSDDEVVFVDRT